MDAICTFGVLVFFFVAIYLIAKAGEAQGSSDNDWWNEPADEDGWTNGDYVLMSEMLDTGGNDWSEPAE